VNFVFIRDGSGKFITVFAKWVATHHKHHAKCETADAPHSPKIYGMGKVLFKGTELYRMESNNPQ